jgi:hypothetical protein
MMAMYFGSLAAGTDKANIPVLQSDFDFTVVDSRGGGKYEFTLSLPKDIRSVTMIGMQPDTDVEVAQHVTKSSEIPGDTSDSIGPCAFAPSITSYS